MFPDLYIAQCVLVVWSYFINVLYIKDIFIRVAQILISEFLRYSLKC